MGIQMDKEKLLDVLFDFFGHRHPAGTYFYNLTRVKEAFHVGTMTLDDFEEVTEEQVEELANIIIKKLAP